MRSRSNSGVRLDFYQRMVQKTILKYQVQLCILFQYLDLMKISHCMSETWLYINDFSYPVLPLLSHVSFVNSEALLLKCVTHPSSSRFPCLGHNHAPSSFLSLILLVIRMYLTVWKRRVEKRYFTLPTHRYIMWRYIACLEAKLYRLWSWLDVNKSPKAIGILNNFQKKMKERTMNENINVQWLIILCTIMVCHSFV